MPRILLIPDLPLERWPSMDRYASRLARRLPEAAPDLEIALAGRIGPLTVDPAPGDERQSDPYGAPPIGGVGEAGRYVARYWRYPRRVRRTAADLLHVLDHSYAHVLLSSSYRPAVVSVHDLLPLITVRRGARTMRERIRNRLLGRVLDGIRGARAWIVATEWLKLELAEWLEREDGIHVIPYGVDGAFFDTPSTSKEETRADWDIPASAFVVLHVGSVGERKNIPTVIECVHGLRTAGVEAWLLQVGGHFTAQQERAVKRFELKNVTRSIGEAAEPLLRAAYRAADVLLFPSHYEGFGLPVLEAMASGLPVVCSRAGGLSEVAGDDALTIDAREAEPYITALRRLASEPALRRDYAARGLARAKRYRWIETAKRTAEVYRGLL